MLNEEQLPQKNLGPTPVRRARGSVSEALWYRDHDGFTGCIAVADVCNGISVRCRIVRPLAARADDDPEVRAAGWEGPERRLWEFLTPPAQH